MRLRTKRRAGEGRSLSIGVFRPEIQKIDYARRSAAGTVAGRGFDSPRLHFGSPCQMSTYEQFEDERVLQRELRIENVVVPPCTRIR